MRRLWQVLLTIFVVAVAVNYLWELAQSPLFVPGSHVGNVWLHCFVASLGDGLMVLLLYAIGWVAAGRSDWFARPTIRDYSVLVAAGAVLGLVVEWGAVHLLQRWTYTDAMPRLPGIEIGVVPIIQMIVLPPIVFRITSALTAQLHEATVQRR